MGSNLHALIAQGRPQLRDALTLLRIRSFDLPQSLLLIPLPENALAETSDDAVLGFMQLNRDTVDVALKLSQGAPIAYVEQWTFAGPGEQAAVVWTAGDISFGPAFTTTETDAEPPYLFVHRLEETAVNAALRELGVDRGEHLDEYAALGLDAKRHTEDWLNEEPPPELSAPQRAIAGSGADKSTDVGDPSRAKRWWRRD